MFRYLPLLLLACALALVSLRSPAPASAVAVPDYVTTGGWFTEPPYIINDVNQKANFGGVLQCDAPFDQPNQLIVHYGDQAEFKLDTLSSATCNLNNVNDPNSGGRYRGTGTGTCNGGPATALLIEFNDDGQGNPNDSARFTITGSMPGCTFAVFATALGGGQIILHAH